MGPFYADTGPDRGPMLYPGAPRPIPVFADPGGRQLVGFAVCIAADSGGAALGRLVIEGAALPGRWALVHREFRPAP
jgi:hypothetical protein